MDFKDIKISSPGEIEACKICGSPAPFYGGVDFNKSCEERHGLVLPETKIIVGYNKCPRCKFIFTTAFDHWGRKEFGEAIYNEDYKLVDPDYKGARPESNASWLTQMFAADKGVLSLLDYGGGNGLLAEKLFGNGFLATSTYEPFNPAFSTLPDRKFNIVTCFETFEHVPDPRNLVATLAKCVDDNGLVVFSTLTQPEDLDQAGLSWWYAAPRNGHISLYSTKTLALLWKQQGFVFGSFDRNMHLAYRKLPDFARHLS